MRMTKVIMLMLMLIMGVLFVNRYGFADSRDQVTKQKWEYCFVLGSFPQGDGGHYKAQVIFPETTSDKIAKEMESSFEGVALLNKLGAEGWEIVGTIPTNQSDRTEYVLKRARS